jgi:hypothetical protein
MKLTIEGIEYEWSGGFGATLKSMERNIPHGMLRMVAGELLQAWRQYPRGPFRRREIWWNSANSPNDAEWIRQYRIKLLEVSSWPQ